jgi:competence protein ComEC
MRLGAFAGEIGTRLTWRALADAVVRPFVAERDRWPLWTPILLGVGVLAYFDLAAEPPAWIGAVAAPGAFVVAWIVRRHQAALIAALAAGSVGLGFAAVQLRADLVAAPALSARIGWAAVEGRVVRVETLPQGGRILLDRVSIAGVRPEATPGRIRVRTMTTADEAFAPGDLVAVRAELSPPPGPAAPGAFDFARRAWFEGIGAVGFAVGKPRLLARATDEPFAFSVALARLRAAMTERIRAALPGDAGAIAAALITGERSAISEDTLSAMRDSGLAHLLAISGLHFALVAGILFFGVRLLLAALPSIALEHPIKKWAAIAAFAGAAAYLFISGASVPATRAFVMISIVLLAVLTDRSAISMRLIAWAAAALVLLQPESLTGPSFQMSFAAVMALIAAYEAASGRFASWRREAGPARRAGIYLAGILLSSVVATLATAPYAAYHFNRLAVFGLVANLAAVPITSLWVMPWAVAACLLMPFGLETVALAPMGWGIEAVAWVARTTADWPGAAMLVPTMSGESLALVTSGGVWLCLWRRRWRALGLAPIALGIALVPLAPRPDLLVDGSGRLVALRGQDGALALSTRSAAKFEANIWLRHNAQRAAAPWPDRNGAASGQSAENLTCDRLGCIWRAKGQVVSLAWRPAALAEDCRIATVLVSREPVRRACPRPAAVIDRWSLWRDGAHAVFLSPEGVRVESARGASGDRPWVRRPEARTGQ